MTENESELHSRLEERDAEIEASRSEILKVNAEIIEARATIARVEAWCNELDARAKEVPGNGQGARSTRAILIGLADQCRAALATQPTEARP